MKGSETKLIQNQLFVDGVHNHSTGSIYFYNELTMGDKNNYLQKYADSGQEVTLSINPSNSYKCLDSHSLDLNDWQCTRLVVTGSLVNVTDLEEVSSVKKTFKERHDMSLDTDRIYRLSISRMRLIQVLTGDYSTVDVDLYVRSREDPMMDSSEISLDDKNFVRKMKALHSHRKHLRSSRAVV